MSRWVRLRLGFCCALGLGALPAYAYSPQRLSIGLGAVTLQNPSRTELQVGGEYEYRPQPVLGFGLQGNYIFSSPSIALVGAPELFVHPFGGGFFVSASPLVEFGSGIQTHWGSRWGTRIPIALGTMDLIPSFAVDFIGGTQDYLYGLGIQM